MLQILKLICVCHKTTLAILLLDDGLYEGDMLLSVEQQQQVKDGTFGYGAKLGMQWPKGIIYYTIASNLGKLEGCS